ncbi:MAG TPA: hypothetical protein VGL81_07505 [Polyangiaceae bacterium]|jgi:hypothetical protein
MTTISPGASRKPRRVILSRAAWQPLAGALLTLLACSTATTPQTAVVVGIQSEPLSGAIGTLHVVTTLGGQPSTDETISPAALPHEVKLVPPGGNVAAPIAVEVDGYESATWTVGSPDPPVLVRTAETSFVEDQTLLLRVMLQGACLLALPGGPPGAPTCVAPQTCIGGTCQDDVVPPASLEPYTPGWANDLPDVCKPLNAGPPVVQVGTGQTDYLPLTDGQTVQAEQGPQGGHHIWIAVRQENLKQAGSTTTITSVQPGTNLAGPQMAFVFDFQQDQGGFCTLYGLRYQLDLDGTDYHLFLGQPLDVTVVIADPSGATGTGVAHIDIAPTLLCPSGIPGCPDDAGGGTDGD